MSYSTFRALEHPMCHLQAHGPPNAIQSMLVIGSPPGKGWLVLAPFFTLLLPFFFVIWSFMVDCGTLLFLWQGATSKKLIYTQQKRLVDLNIRSMSVTHHRQQHLLLGLVGFWPGLQVVLLAEGPLAILSLLWHWELACPASWVITSVQCCVGEKCLVWWVVRVHMQCM